MLVTLNSDTAVAVHAQLAASINMFIVISHVRNCVELVRLVCISSLCAYVCNLKIIFFRTIFEVCTLRFLAYFENFVAFQLYTRSYLKQVIHFLLIVQL